MATATIQPFGKYLENSFKGNIAIATAAFKCMLCNATYAPNMDTEEFLTAARAQEVTGTNWAAGGVSVAMTAALDAATHQYQFSVPDISVATVTLTGAKTLVIYNNTPATDATRHVVAYGTLDVALSPSAGTLAIDFATVTFNIDYN